MEINISRNVLRTHCRTCRPEKGKGLANVQRLDHILFSIAAVLLPRGRPLVALVAALRAGIRAGLLGAGRLGLGLGRIIVGQATMKDYNWE